jgi:hypothetical protein
VPITTKVVSLNPANGKVYSIQHYVIKFVIESGYSSFLHQYDVTVTISFEISNF